jgi:hypothetical protein
MLKLENMLSLMSSKWLTRMVHGRSTEYVVYLRECYTIFAYCQMSLSLYLELAFRQICSRRQICLGPGELSPRS